MSTELNSFKSTEVIVDDLLIEKIRRDLGKQITHEEIRRVVLEVAAEFQDATIPTFVPIFIHRLTLERLNNPQ